MRLSRPRLWKYWLRRHLHVTRAAARTCFLSFFFFNDPPTTEIYTLSLHDALPICADPYWQKNESYRAVLEAPKYARTPGWPGPLTAAAAEVVATHVLTDLCARVIVDGWDIEKALEEADKRIKDIYANVPSR